MYPSLVRGISSILYSINASISQWFIRNITTFSFLLQNFINMYISQHKLVLYQYAFCHIGDSDGVSSPFYVLEGWLVGICLGLDNISLLEGSTTIIFHPVKSFRHSYARLRYNRLCYHRRSELLYDSRLICFIEIEHQSVWSFTFCLLHKGWRICYISYHTWSHVFFVVYNGWSISSSR